MKKLYWFLIAFLLISISCNKGEKRINYKDTIPPEDLIPLITDIHLADAVLGMPSFLKRMPGRDSLSNYQDIFDSHGYSSDQFELTLKYYADHPVEFEVIYEKILSNLSKLESEIKSHRYGYDELESPENLWLEKPEWFLPEDGGQIKIPFSIPIDQAGFYIIRARIKMYNNDGSEDPKIIAYFWYDDGTAEGKKIWFPESRILKNDNWKYHTISLKYYDPKITHLKGFLLEHRNGEGDWAKHVEIENISVRLRKARSSETETN